MKRTLYFALAFSVVSGFSAQVQAAEPAEIVFNYCSDLRATNCIESIAIVDEAGKISSGQHIPGTLSEFEFKNIKFASGDGRVNFWMSWRPDGAGLCWWDQCDYHAGSIDMGIAPTSSLAGLNAGVIAFEGESQNQCGSKEQPTTCGKWFNFGGNYTFNFRFRATGFDLGMISGRAKDVVFKKINVNVDKGESQTYEVSASNIVSDSYVINQIRTSQPRDRIKADYFSDGLIMWFWDVNNSATSRLPSKCSAKNIQGPPTQLLFNTFNMGAPSWNPVDSSLSVQLESAHLAHDGTVNKGFYEMVFSKATAECLWGINPEKSAKAEVSISYTDGSKADIATVVQSYRDGMIKISASNFHLSTPIISTKLVSEISVSQVVAKKKAITCVRKAVIKKIVGLNPKCPQGYKKK
jgi:hypothetical protein